MLITSENVLFGGEIKMKGVAMYYTVKTMLEQGKSISAVAREVGIDRKTVRKIRDRIKNGEIRTPVMKRRSKLDNYKEEIIGYLEKGFSAVLIHQKLKEKGVDITYSGVKKNVRKLKGPKEAHVPIVSPPGKEAQVDFGYAGYFNNGGKKVKTWIFCMRLSYSRYDYYELVTSQNVATFIRCHINAFEYFGGVPETVKIDNLKAGVLEANFYEPEIQHEYANMLSFYGSGPITCKVRKPEEKGKVEAAIKYVKNNFLKSLDTRDLKTARKKLREWMENICNQRIHGTTRKIPAEEFKNKEKPFMISLPAKRYERYVIEKRRVDRYGHVSYRYNYYSLPHKYVGEEVTIKAGGDILRIYDREYNEIAVHPIDKGTGNFITRQEHIPKTKQRKGSAYYEEQCSQIGLGAVSFFRNLKSHKPHRYHRLIQGILSLRKYYTDSIINSACIRADRFGCYSFKSVKKICEEGLFEAPAEINTSAIGGGYGNNLKDYDANSGGAK